MGSIGPAEILIVLVVALIVLGPTRLPEAARSLGKALAEVRRMSSGLQSEVRDAFAEQPPTYPSTRTDAAALPADGGEPAAPSPLSPPSPPDQGEVTVVRDADPPPSA